jgi:hypothetical protein
MGLSVEQPVGTSVDPCARLLPFGFRLVALMFVCVLLSTGLLGAFLVWNVLKEITNTALE